MIVFAFWDKDPSAVLLRDTDLINFQVLCYYGFAPQVRCNQNKIYVFAELKQPQCSSITHPPISQGNVEVRASIASPSLALIR
jgi:hypothetical protein